MGRWLVAPLSAALLAYPFAVYFLLQKLQAAVLGGILFVLVVVRYVIARKALGTSASQAQPALKSLLPLTLVGVASGVAIVLSNHPLAVRLNPVWISLTMLMIFSWTLYSPPSMIERFARLTEPALSPVAIRYTRQVTKVWCAFFIVNAAIALWTALWTPLSWWTLYNGLFSYLLMGILFAAEYLVRRRVQYEEQRRGASKTAEPMATSTYGNAKERV